jgi:hypothetical protein
MTNKKWGERVEKVVPRISSDNSFEISLYERLFRKCLVIFLEFKKFFSLEKILNFPKKKIFLIF